MSVFFFANGFDFKSVRELEHATALLNFLVVYLNSEIVCWSGFRSELYKRVQTVAKLNMYYIIIFEGISPSATGSVAPFAKKRSNYIYVVALADIHS